MDDVHKEILTNQLIIMYQLANLNAVFNRVLKTAGEKPIQKGNNCRLLEDRARITRKLLKEIDE